MIEAARGGMTVPGVCLVVLDGWGLAPEGPGNAVSLADTPVFDRLWEEHPHTTLTAMRRGRRAAGGPDGQLGGRPPQPRRRRDRPAGPRAHRRGGRRTARWPRTRRCGRRSRTRRACTSSASCPTGGVHSSDRHLKALIETAARNGVEDLVVHAFTDGRDTSPTPARTSVADGRGDVREAGTGRVACVIGRYFAMDRDKRWDRTQKALDLLVRGQGRAPRRHGGGGRPRRLRARRDGRVHHRRRRSGEEGRIRPGDSVIAFNFRPDRMRQIAPKLAEVVDRYTTMTPYEEDWTFPVLFPKHRPAITIGAGRSRRRARQLHVAETEKYPHVTYFFNGGREEPYEGEVRELVPSPRDVPTYDQKPEMSAREATERFVRALGRGRVRVRDHQLRQPGHGRPHGRDRGGGEGGRDRRRVPRAGRRGGRTRTGGACIVTADHGNCDQMLEEDGSPDTAHSLNPVPFIVTRGRGRARRGGHPRRRRADRAGAARASTSRTR